MTDLIRHRVKPRKLDNEMVFPGLHILPNATIEIHGNAPGTTGISLENANIHSEGRIVTRGVENPIRIRGGQWHYFKHLDFKRSMPRMIPRTF